MRTWRSSELAPDRLCHLHLRLDWPTEGVPISHRSLMNLVTWHQRTYAVTPADRATHVASPAFDASVWETWPYLTAGASVHIPDDDTRLSPARLWRWMHETE
jgi:non-ribosomal peptide synthetase component F